MDTVRCSSCKKGVVPIPPGTAWKIANLVFWIAILVVAPLYGGIVGLSLVLAPVWLAMAGSIGSSARRASEWTCPICHEEVHAPTPRAPEPGIAVPHYA